MEVIFEVIILLGALYISELSLITFSECSFKSNSAELGGGISYY